MESTPAGVHEAITFLCKGQGFNETRLASRQALVAVLGGPGTHPDMLTERFVAAINSIGGPTAEILGDSLRLTERAWNLKTLKERRTLHGSLQDPAIGWEAVADRAETAIDHLVAVLVGGRYPKSPIPTRIAESHSGIAIYRMGIHVIIRDRRHEETRYRFQMVGLADDVDYFGIDTRSTNVPRLISEDFSLQMKLYDNGQQLQFWPDKPMMRGKTYDLRYYIRNASRDEHVLTGEWMAFHEPTRFATFTVSFIGDKPKMIWRVDRLTGIAAPGEPTRDTRLNLDAHQTARTEFSDLYGGLNSGIAWNW